MNTMSTTRTTAATEPDYDMIDLVAEALTDTAASPSKIARKAKVTTNQAHEALRWLARNEMAIVVGNGTWANYRTRRAGEYNNPDLR
jgi:streptomycin 6-kinase